MGKQSEAPKIGDGKNKHLREEESHSHTPRTSDSACVRFLTESAMLSRRNLHCGDIWSEFLTQQITGYRRPPQVWVREWNLWAPRQHLCQQTFFRIANFPCCEGEAMFRHHLVNLRGHKRLNFDREGHAFLPSFALIHRHEQVFNSCHGRISTHCTCRPQSRAAQPHHDEVVHGAESVALGA